MDDQTILKTNSEKKSTFKVNGISKKQLSMLKENKLPLAVFAGIFGGMAAEYAFINSKYDLIEEEIDNEDTEVVDTDTKEEIFDFEAPTTIEFSDAVNDDMTFSEAYSAARNDIGSGGFFNWHGQSYHTLNKEEWEALSEEERQEYIDKICENTNFEDGTSTDVTPTPDDNIIDDEIEYVDPDDFADADEIIDGMNDGEATTEEEGIVIEDEDTEDDNEIEYDEDSLDDLIDDDLDFNT